MCPSGEIAVRKGEHDMSHAKGRHAMRAAAVVFALLPGGCRTAVEPIEGIQCHYRFRNVEREQDRERIAKVIASAAKGDVRKGGSDMHPEYFFTVKNLDVLDRMHPKIVYDNPTAEPHELNRVFNYREPQFSILYETIDIKATIRVIVTFRITPGARLFYKPQGRGEKDITDLVGEDGTVTLETQIGRGQEYIYGRTLSGEVQRFIKINVYTQKVTDIDESEYP
jgi:hypothetical protein